MYCNIKCMKILRNFSSLISDWLGKNCKIGWFCGHPITIKYKINDYSINLVYFDVCELEKYVEWVFGMDSS